MVLNNRNATQTTLTSEVEGFAMFCEFCEAGICGGEINCIIFVEFYREKMIEYEKIFRLFKVIIIHFSKFAVNENSLMRLSFVLE